MTTPRRPGDVASALRRLRLDVARVVADRLDDDDTALLHEWLQGLPVGDGTSGADPVRVLGVGFTPDLDRLTWWAVGDIEPMIASTLDAFELVGADPDQVDRLASLGPLVEPDLLGDWLQFRPGTHDAGWTMRGGIVSTDLLAVVDDVEHDRTLTEWFAEHPNARVTSLARSVGTGSTTWRTVIDLTAGEGGPTADQALVAGTALLAALHAPLPPDDVLGAILDELGEPDLALAIWGLDDGLARAGLRIADPTPALIVRMATLQGWADQLDAVARMLGSLDVELATWLEVSVDADGWGSELGVEWTLPVDSTADSTVD